MLASLWFAAAVSVAPAATQSISQGQSATINATAGQSVTLSASASGTAPFSYQWKKDGVAILGATSASYSIAAATTNDTGTYSVVIANAAGTATSGSATLFVSAAIIAPSITTQPVASTVTAGGAASFSIVAAGSAPLTYQWRKDGVNIPGATADTLSITNAQNGNAGAYSVVVTNAAGSVTSGSASLTVNAIVVAPSITTQPAAVTVTAGGTASFSVVASGSAPFSYQWRKDGVNIPGATDSTLSITNAQSGNAGAYSVVVTNTAGSVTSGSASLTITAALVAPSISTQPAAATVTAGATATFSVAASGSAPLAYQWRKDGVAIPGATANTLSISNAQSGNAGAYSVVVTNAAGSAASSGATLTVNAAVVAPSITTQPASATIASGGALNLSVNASGTGPFTYQWRKDGVNINGATAATYSVAQTNSASAGSYTVVITNAAGSVTSTAAVIAISTSSGSNGGSNNGNTGGNGGTGGSSGAKDNRLAGLASRCFVGTGADIAISGFIVSGTQPKRLLIRGTGPGLSAYGLGGAMQTPVMTVFAGSDEIARNEGWKASNAQEIRDAISTLGLGALPEDGRDCALVATFNPGAYTVQLKDKNGGVGVGLIEIYDLDAASSNGLIGISTRAGVGRGGDILITGLVVTGSSPKTVLLRALGPALASLGVGGCLQNPVLKVFAGSNQIASNTVWGTSPDKTAIAAATAKIGLFAIDEAGADSALLITLQPGAYTIQVSGLHDTTGVALLEAYEVPAN